MLALPVGGQPLPLNLLHGHECHLSLSSVLAEQVHRSHRHLEERAARGCGGAGCPQVHRAHLPRRPRGRGPRKRIVRHDVILPWTPPNQKARAEPHLPFSFCQIVAYLEQPREAQVRRKRPVRAGIRTPNTGGSRQHPRRERGKGRCGRRPAGPSLRRSPRPPHGQRPCRGEPCPQLSEGQGGQMACVRSRRKTQTPLPSPSRVGASREVTQTPARS